MAPNRMARALHGQALQRAFRTGAAGIGLPKSRL
jgi:hypothetical protein